MLTIYSMNCITNNIVTSSIVYRSEIGTISKYRNSAITR